ncbi:MAG: hypothetical protein ABW068_17345, partial [Candidatus Thiodiazotropha sp.]
MARLSYLGMEPFLSPSPLAGEGLGERGIGLTQTHHIHSSRNKRVFDLMKDFGTSKSTKIDSIFDSLLVP